MVCVSFFYYFFILLQFFLEIAVLLPIFYTKVMFVEIIFFVCLCKMFSISENISLSLFRYAVVWSAFCANSKSLLFEKLFLNYFLICLIMSI